MNLRQEQEDNGHVHLHEPLNDAVRAKVEAALPMGEELLIRVFSDLTTEHTYGAQWLLLTPQRLLVVAEKGDAAVVDVPIADIKLARTEPLVGGVASKLNALRRRPCTYRTRASWLANFPK